MTECSGCGRYAETSVVEMASGRLAEVCDDCLDKIEGS